MSNPEIIINAELGGSVEINSEITAAANLTPIIEEAQIVCEVVAAGPQGPEGPAGQGLIPGGTTGQVLAKKSNTDFDTEWVNAGGGSTEVFWATYNSTTSSEIEAAYQAGKIVACLNSERCYYLINRESATLHRFFSYSGSDNYVRLLTCNNNSWSAGSRSVASASTTLPEPLGVASYGSGSSYARSNHVHAMPSASNVGAVAVAQGVGHAGEFLVVGSDGNVTTVTLATWQGGSY